MTDTKHTPGPWKVFSNSSGGLNILTEDGWGQDRPWIASVYCNHVGVGDEGKANAHLISTAPKLLEALEAAIDCGMVPKSTAKEGGAAGYAIQAKVADQIRAVIAEARGES